MWSSVRKDTGSTWALLHNSFKVQYLHSSTTLVAIMPAAVVDIDCFNTFGCLWQRIFQCTLMLLKLWRWVYDTILILMENMKPFPSLKGMNKFFIYIIYAYDVTAWKENIIYCYQPFRCNDGTKNSCTKAPLWYKTVYWCSLIKKTTKRSNTSGYTLTAHRYPQWEPGSSINT